jgi:hypothetical protein
MPGPKSVSMSAFIAEDVPKWAIQAKISSAKNE